MISASLQYTETMQSSFREFLSCITTTPLNNESWFSPLPRHSLLKIGYFYIPKCCALKNILISRYARVFNNESISITLMDELNAIKNGSCRTLVESARKNYAADKEAYGKYKRMLPAVTFSGVFGAQRKLDYLNKYVPVIVFDIDHIDKSNLPDIKAAIGKDKHILAVWLSPSGEGLKFLIKTNNTDPNDHKYYFDAGVKYFQQEYSVIIDVSGSDPTRLCFTSFDPEIIISNDYVLFTNKLIPEQRKDTVASNRIAYKNIVIDDEVDRINKKSDKELLGRILRFLTRKKTSITTSYDSWFKVALAIANTFTYDAGEKLFLDLCRLDKEAHDEEKSISLLQYAYRNRLLNVVTMGTIVYLAQQKGFEMRKVRNIVK